MDQNWYTQDLSPKPPRQKSYLWVWILGGCFVMFTGLIAAVVLIVASQIPPGKNFGEWIAETASQDDSQVVEFRASAASQRLLAARAAYGEQLLPSNDVSSDEIQMIQSFLRDLKQAMQSNDDKAFEAKFSLPEFKDRVRKASSLSFSARRGFSSQFEEWYTTYSPYSSSLSGIELVSVKRDPTDHTFIAYTWVFNSVYPDRVAWYLHSNGQQMRLVDYEILDTCQLESDSCARQFSAAFTGTFWNNFLEVLEYTADDLTTSEGIAASKADVLRMSKLTFPKSIAHEAYYRLSMLADNVDDNDLCLEMLVKAEKLADMPAVYWQRATVFQQLQDFAKAEANLREYTDRLGEGPETYYLAAELATAQKQFDKANAAWINLLATFPATPFVPWNFHHQMSAHYGTILATSIEARPEKAQAAQQIATLLIARERFDLAEPLIPIAESANEPTPELFALRAEFAELQGRDDEYLKNIESAWKSAAPDHPSRPSWIYDWSTHLLNAGKVAESIQQSPNPGQTYFNLAMDEDGQPILKLEQLQQLSDALQTATAIDEADQNWLQTWRRLAPVVVMLEKQDNPAAWESLHSLLKEDATNEDKQIVEFLNEEDQFWIVADWIGTAATQTAHLPEVWNLLPVEDRLRTLIWKAEELKTPDAISTIQSLLKQETPDSCDILYCDALKAKISGDIPGAIENFQKFTKHPGVSESDFSYSGRNSLAELAISQPDWKTVVGELPATTIVDNVASELILKQRIDDAQTALELARSHGAEFSSTVALEASILTARQDWQTLSALCDRWIAEVNPAEESSQTRHFAFGDLNSQFIDAALHLGNIQRAEDLLSTFPADHNTATHRFRIAVMKADQVAAEKAFTDAETESSSPPRISELGAAGLTFWSEEWRDFRRRHPVTLNAIYGGRADETTAILFQSSAGPVAADEILKRLQAVQEDAKVEDHTEILRQQEMHIIEIATATLDDPGKAAQLHAGERQFFRVTLSGVPFALFFGNDQFHAPAGSGTDEDSDAWALDDLSDTLKLLIQEHQSWIVIRQEGIANNDLDAKTKAVFPQLIAAISNDQTSVVNVNYNAAPMADQVRSMLKSGQTGDLPASEPFAFSKTDPLASALDANSTARLRALSQRLAEISDNGEEPGIEVIIRQGGFVGRDQLMMKARLLGWEPKGFPTEFTVELASQEIVPQLFRNETVKINRWNILDWQEVKP